MSVEQLAKDQVIELDQSLQQFLEEWDYCYNKKVAMLPLFDVSKTKLWTNEQRQYFVKTFYHIRGHFHEFLWYLGNFAPDKKCKDMVLQNIQDELGDRGMSHEKLYHIFAEELGVDLTNEMIEGETNLPFIREFNKGYIRWMHQHNWPMRVSAFAALERLDNVDYANTKAIAESLGVQGRALAFFNVHMNSKHFETVLIEGFYDAWKEDPEKVKYAFNFVSDYQSNAWRMLSDEINNYQSPS